MRYSKREHIIDKIIEPNAELIPFYTSIALYFRIGGGTHLHVMRGTDVDLIDLEEWCDALAQYTGDDDYLIFGDMHSA